MVTDTKSLVVVPLDSPTRLREWRLKSRLSQGEVAKLLDISVATVNRHESGNRGLTHDLIIKYARLYKVPTYALFYKPAIEERPDLTIEPVPYAEYEGGFNAEKNMEIAR